MFFANEPIIRVVAPLPEAQLVETRIMNILHFQTMIASKAARAVLQAPGKLLVDFGLRRAHGAEAGLYAARATYLAGMSGTATVLAGQRYGVPIFGTMAHSFIQAHDSETQAFENFARSHPDNITLLIDTYDTEAAARKIVQLAPDLARDGIRIRAVRLDSGDLAEHARQVRRIFDDGRLARGEDLRQRRASTSLRCASCSPSSARPSTASASAAAWTPPTMCPRWIAPTSCRSMRAGRAASARRARPPGRAASRCCAATRDSGLMSGDLLALEHERDSGEPLLRQIMRAGQRLPGLETLEQARERCRSSSPACRLPCASSSRLPRIRSPYPARCAHWQTRSIRSRPQPPQAEARKRSPA